MLPVVTGPAVAEPAADAAAAAADGQYETVGNLPPGHKPAVKSFHRFLAL